MTEEELRRMVYGEQQNIEKKDNSVVGKVYKYSDPPESDILEKITQIGFSMIDNNKFLNDTQKAAMRESVLFNAYTQGKIDKQQLTAIANMYNIKVN